MTIDARVYKSRHDIIQRVKELQDCLMKKTKQTKKQKNKKQIKDQNQKKKKK